ncbi:hypothetical protein [Cucumibacter marinus]|uniref:hypothetical protein n=1 Tax=Cucumibacter marinus TaxID=1121252 RepID=UPI000426E5CF|nr:hypothetical protein [Cucumibacter marinus]
MRDQDEESLGPGRLDACYGRPYRPDLVGIFDLAVGPHHLSDEGLIATCMRFFVMPDICKSLLGGRVAAILIRQVRNWAKDRAKNRVKNRVKNNNAISLTIHGTNGMVARMVKGGKVIGVNVISNNLLTQHANIIGLEF